MGRRVQISTGCFVGAGPAGLTLGDDVLISPSCTILTGTYQFERLDVPLQQQGTISKGVRIGHRVWVGSNSVVLAGSELGDNVIVSAGSVVSGRVIGKSVETALLARIAEDARAAGASALSAEFIDSGRNQVASVVLSQHGFAVGSQGRWIRSLAYRGRSGPAGSHPRPCIRQERRWRIAGGSKVSDALLGVGLDLAEQCAFSHLDDASIRRAAGRWLRREERAWCAEQSSFRKGMVIVLSCKEAVSKHGMRRAGLMSFR